MKICLVSPQSPGYGGYGVYILYLVRGLRERGHQVHTLTGPPPLGQPFRDQVNSHTVPTGSYEGLRFVNFELQINSRLKQLHRRERFNLIHYNLPAYLGIPLFHSPSLPLLVTGHGCIEELIRGFLHYRPLGLDLGDVIYLAGGPFSSRMERWAFSQANRVIAVSDSVKTSLIRYYGLPERCVTTVHNGVDTEHFSPVKDAKEKIQRYLGPENLERPLVLYLGRLMGAKDPSTLVQAMPRVLESHPDALFLFRGEGVTLHAGIRSLLARLVPRDSYRFIGFVRDEDLPSLYSAASAYVLPSIYEPFAYTLLEAMSCGAPSIASRVGGIPEMIEQERDGILVEPRNPLQLADAIIRMLNDSRLARRLGEKGRRRVEENFNLDVFVEGFEREMRLTAG